MSQSVNFPSTDEDDKIKDAGNDEEVARKDELMVESVGDEPKRDCKRQRDRPKCDGVTICEKDLQGIQIVFESFLF